jgi:hypothetical protein
VLVWSGINPYNSGIIWSSFGPLVDVICLIFSEAVRQSPDFISFYKIPLLFLFL